MTGTFGYSEDFEVFRMDAEEARAAYGAGGPVDVTSVQDPGQPSWHVAIARRGFVVTFNTGGGAPLREATWVRSGDELLLRTTVDFFYPDGDPRHRQPLLEVLYVERSYAASGVVTVTFSPPGRVSGESKPKKRTKRRGEVPAYADHDQRDDVRNGPVHTVRDVQVPRLPIPEFGMWKPLLAASAPEDLVRVGPGAEAAAREYADARP